MKRNIVHYVTRQYMKQNKKRTLTAYIGIVFMVMLMTCVFIGKNTGLSFIGQVAQQKYGKWHVCMYGIKADAVSALKDIDYVKETAASADYGDTEFLKSGNKEKPYLTVKAYSKNCFDWMNITLKEGRLPKNGNELVISESALEDGAKIKTGDTVSAEFFKRSITGIDKETEKTVFPFYNIKVSYKETVEVPQGFPYFGENDSFRENKTFTGKKENYKVVGIIERPGFEMSEGGGYIAITGLDRKDMQKAERLNLSLMLDLEKTPILYANELRERVVCEKMDFNDYVLSFAGISSDSTVNGVVTGMVIFFTALVMTASIVLIYNVFNISYKERSRYLGMLSSVGATGKQKRSSVYYEAFTLLIPALPVGILLGTGVIKAGITAIKPLLGKFMNLETFIQDVSVRLVISWEEIAVVLLVSVVTVMVSAFLPARKIGKTGSITYIRGSGEIKDRQYPMKKAGIFSFGGEGLLAKNTVKRQRKKTKSVVAAVVTFLVVTTVTVFGALAVQTLIQAKLRNADGMSIPKEKIDYVLMTMGEDEEQYQALKAEIEKNPDVSNAVQWYDGMFAGQVKSEVYSREYWDAVHEIFNLYYRRELSEKEFRKLSGYGYEQVISVMGVDDKTFAAIAEKADVDPLVLKNTENAFGIVVSDGEMSTDTRIIDGYTPESYRYFRLDHMTDLQKNEKMEVQFYSSKEEKTTTLPVTIAGFADGKDLEKYIMVSGQYLYLIVNESTIMKMKEKAEGSQAFSPMLYFKWNGKDNHFINELSSINEKNDDLYFAPVNYTKNFSDAIIEIVNVLAGCFALVVSAICFLNLFNAICGRMAERKGEFAVMTSIGMTRRQIQKMLLLENIRLLTGSLFAAGVLTFILTKGLGKAMESMFGKIGFAFPWAFFTAAVFLAALAVIGITFGCFRKNKQENLLEEIRGEGL